MKLGLRDCTLLDILSVYREVCADERAQIDALGLSSDDSDVAAKLWGYGGVRFCLCVNETLEPVGVFGAYPVNNGNAYRVWMFAKVDAFERYSEEITHNVGHCLAETYVQLGVKTFELVVLARRLLAQRWYVKLGFVKTGQFGYGTAPRHEFLTYSYTGEKT